MTLPAEPFIPSPFVVVIDSREQDGWTFEGAIRADADQEHAKIAVRTEVRGLKSGDYSIADFENRIAIERKSHQDLFATLGQGRERFIRELERLNEFEFAAVVCESSWEGIAFYPPERSQMKCKSVIRSIFAFMQRYPRVHWLPMGGRRMAEVTTYRLLERFWKDDQKKKQGGAAA